MKICISKITVIKPIRQNFITSISRVGNLTEQNTISIR